MKKINEDTLESIDIINRIDKVLNEFAGGSMPASTSGIASLTEDSIAITAQDIRSITKIIKNSINKEEIYKIFQNKLDGKQITKLISIIANEIQSNLESLDIKAINDQVLNETLDPHAASRVKYHQDELDAIMRRKAQGDHKDTDDKEISRHKSRIAHFNKSHESLDPHAAVLNESQMNEMGVDAPGVRQSISGKLISMFHDLLAGANMVPKSQEDLNDTMEELVDRYIEIYRLR
jgi:alpha-glucuronidase